MGRIQTSSMAHLFCCLVAVLGIPGCGGGGGGGGHHPPAPTLESGLFKACQFQVEQVGPVWESNSLMFGCSMDGIDAVGIDLDLDGVYADDSLNYECRPDGTIGIGDEDEGVYSQDGELVAVTEAVSTGHMDMVVSVREGSGMSVANFTGAYLVTSFAFNGATGVAHTYAMVAGQTGEGLGLFSVLNSSDPAAVGVTSPFAFTVEDDGAFAIVDSGDRGGLKSDGSMFVTADTNDTNDIDSIMFGIRTGSGLDSRILRGEYILNMVGQHTVTKALWTARILATFDGVGVARYEFLAHPTAGGLTGYLAYSVNDPGFLVIMVLPTGPMEFGIVSADGETFSVIDANPSDDDIYALIGIKRPE
jgi:hypothetical protein